MKKIVVFLIVTFLIDTFYVSSLAEDMQMNATIVDYKIIVNEEDKEIKNPILVINNRTYLPIRETAEVLDLYISWDEEKRTINVSDIGITAESDTDMMEYVCEEKVTVHNSDFNLKVNGYMRETENPIIVFNDRAYLPLREISELLNFEVDWEETERKVIIKRKPTYKTVEEKLLYPFEENGLYGYMNEEKEIVIEPKFTYAKPFSEGLAAVANDEYKFGYINTEGEVVIPHQYSHAEDFSEGLAAVANDELCFDEDDNKEQILSMMFFEYASSYSYIDKTGETVIKDGYRNVSGFHEGFARVSLPFNDDNFLDLDGNAIGNISSYQMVNDLGEVVGVGENAFINKSGEIIATFSEIESDFNSGYAIISVDNKNYIVNNKFDIVFDESKYKIENFNDEFIIAKKNDLYGVIDLDGNVIIDFQYEYLSEYNEGLFNFKKDENYGYIDINNNIIIEPQFQWPSQFVNGRAMVTPSHNIDIMYFINKKQEKISKGMISTQFNVFDNGMVMIYPEGKGIYVNFNGEEMK